MRLRFGWFRFGWYIPTCRGILLYEPASNANAGFTDGFIEVGIITHIFTNNTLTRIIWIWETRDDFGFI